MDEVVPLLLAPQGAGRLRARVRLVDHDELGALGEEHLAALLGLDVVEGDDLEGVVAEDAGVALDAAVEAGGGVGADDLGIEPELVLELGRPLVAQVRRAEHSEPFDHAAVVELAHDEERLDGLPDADVVGYEEADGLLLQRHDERDELVGPRAHREPPERAERSGTRAERQPRRVIKELRRLEVGQVVRARVREVGGDGLLLQEG